MVVVVVVVVVLVDVVLVGGCCVVVVVGPPTTCLSTGVQKSFGASTGSGPSGPNWSRRFTWIVFLGNPAIVAHVGSLAVHAVLPLIL